MVISAVEKYDSFSCLSERIPLTVSSTNHARQPQIPYLITIAEPKRVSPGCGILHSCV